MNHILIICQENIIDGCHIRNAYTESCLHCLRQGLHTSYCTHVRVIKNNSEVAVGRSMLVYVSPLFSLKPVSAWLPLSHALKKNMATVIDTQSTTTKYNKHVLFYLVNCVHNAVWRKPPYSGVFQTLISLVGTLGDASVTLCWWAPLGMHPWPSTLFLIAFKALLGLTRLLLHHPNSSQK